MRGFSCLGLYRPKTAENVGGVMRAAYCYGVSQVVIEGARNSSLTHATNTAGAHKHLPTILTDDLLLHVPHGAQVVVVDLIPGAVALPAFQHPTRAFYVFGPEDGTIGDRHTAFAQHTVYVPTRNCMNLAACVNVVLYDRMAKALRDAKERPPIFGATHPHPAPGG
jgi:tRNA(Leu) C34 or U34 (ribose-2'-O)-methylase TrmL